MKILILAAFVIATPAVAQTVPHSAPVPADSTTPIGDPTPGGYGPANTTLTVPPGANIVYQQAPSPDQAYPAPAPLAKYPLCKKGQTDKCIERGAR